MQTDPSSAALYQYHPLYSGNPSSLTGGTNSTGTTGGGKTSDAITGVIRISYIISVKSDQFTTNYDIAHFVFIKMI